MRAITSGDWVVRTTVDNSGDYPLPTYDIIEIRDWGPQGVACAYQDPRYARLIAAAPDLYMACKEFVRKVEAGEARSTRSYAQMKAAIAKAEGNV